jgi:hypothetical protein
MTTNQSTPAEVYYSVYRLPEFDRNAATYGLKQEDLSNITSSVTSFINDGALYLKHQQFTMRSMLWQKSYTVLYLEVPDALEIFLLNIIDSTQPPEPPKNKKLLKSLLEKIGVAILVAAAKRLFDVLTACTNHGSSTLITLDEMTTKLKMSSIFNLVGSGDELHLLTTECFPIETSTALQTYSLHINRSSCFPPVN